MLALSDPMPAVTRPQHDDHEPPHESVMRRGIREDLRSGVDQAALFRRAIRRQVASDATGLPDKDRHQLIELMCEDPIVRALFDQVYEDVVEQI